MAGSSRVRSWMGCLIAALLVSAQGGSAQATETSQSVLGPGLYVFQTRTRSSTCSDSEKDGYVTSYFAAVHGIPASTSMTMELTNTPYFKQWKLVIDRDHVSGSSQMGTSSESPTTTFDMKLDGDRFKGTGARHYYSVVDGKKRRCSVEYDTLLRRLDL